MPPQSVEAEQSLLGALLLDNRLIDEVSSEVETRDFYRTDHRRIYETIIALYERAEPIDVLTVSEAMSTSAEGGSDNVGSDLAYLGSLAKNTPNTGNALPYAKIVRDRAVLRRLIETANDISRSAYNPEGLETDAVLDRAEQAIFEIARQESRGSEGFQGIGPLLAESLNRVEALFESGDSVSGVATGFTDLDRITGGFQRSDMIVLAARPGMGKTAFVLTMARNVAVEFNVPIAVFSLEMSAVQLVQRLISAETEISSDKFRKGTLKPHEYTQLHERIGKLSEAPLYIDDTPALSVFELRAKCRRLKSTAGIEMVVIDYLQLMTAGSSSGNREQEISTISRSIKSIAKELDIPIIALSQLSRMVETRGGDKRPILSDLRESGAIEQDADMVAFIYRAEYYGLTEHPDGIDTAGLGELILAKHRNGALDTVKLRFIQRLAKFTNYDTFANPVFDRGEFQDGLRPNDDFVNQSTVTVQSKMNEDSGKGGGQKEDMPF